MTPEDQLATLAPEGVPHKVILVGYISASVSTVVLGSAPYTRIQVDDLIEHFEGRLTDDEAASRFIEEYGLTP